MHRPDIFERCLLHAASSSKLRKREKSKKKLYEKPIAHSPSSRNLLNEMRIRRASVMELEDPLDTTSNLPQKQIAGALQTVADDHIGESIENLQSQIEENKNTLENIQKQLSQVTMQLGVLVKYQQQLGINNAAKVIVPNTSNGFSRVPPGTEPQLLD